MFEYKVVQLTEINIQYKMFTHLFHIPKVDYSPPITYHRCLAITDLAISRPNAARHNVRSHLPESQVLRIAVLHSNH